MNARRFFLDQGWGETRGVVTLGGKPERLIIARDDEPVDFTVGSRAVGRIRAIDRGLAMAFVDLGEGSDAILNFSAGIGPLVEGGWVEVEIKSEARRGKAPSVRWLGPAAGPARMLTPGPSVEDRLLALSRGGAIEGGAAARAVADQAQEEALETVFPLSGGGTIAVETTRALTAVDVDVGGRHGEMAKRAARAANLAAISEAARVLRLKGLGGLVVIDLAGRGHDGPVLLAAARAAFAADNPGVAIGAVSRFGALELTAPRRCRPTVEVLCDDAGALKPLTMAMSLARALEREAAHDRGARLTALTAPAVADAASGALTRLAGRFGPRLAVRSQPGLNGYEISRE
ncbi:MAG TPA: ribonuclease E/G [Caulobacteraceae bacterium]|jgi:Ribonuclease G/E